MAEFLLEVVLYGMNYRMNGASRLAMFFGDVADLDYRLAEMTFGRGGDLMLV